jgi:hypothetical protein
MQGDIWFAVLINGKMRANRHPNFILPGFFLRKCKGIYGLPF